LEQSCGFIKDGGLDIKSLYALNEASLVKVSMDFLDSRFE